MTRTGDRLVDAYLVAGPITFAPDTTRAEAFSTMAERDISAAPILEDGRVAGIVALADLFRRPGPPEEPISRVMVRDVVTVAPGSTLRDAARTMTDRRIHCIVVVHEGGKHAGLLGCRDIMRAIAQDRVDTPLSSVMSRPVVTVEARDPIGFALDLLARDRLHGVIVTDRDAPAGVFTELEALRCQTMPAMAPVEGFMSHSLLLLPRETPAHRAASFAIATRARRLLAMDGSRIAGIATGIDLVRLLV